MATKAAKAVRPFVDSVRVRFVGGRGGRGCISMMHLFANEFAGPDGGNGGNGGHIVLRANSRIKSLGHVQSSYYGLDGRNGQGKHMFGASAEHTFVEVPIGTLVTPAISKELIEHHDYDPDASELVADLDVEGSMFVAARGGAGGRGNASYLSNQNRHPRVAEDGAVGDNNNYELRLRLYAHAGLVGLPNAGKSSLLATLTGSQTKIADYPFTTKHPHVGVLEYDDYTQVALSDLPGLIEDSHQNRGLGLQFLRSMRRCACLIFVIDLSNKPISQFDILVRELELFETGISHRPHIIVANKIDRPDGAANLESFKQHVAHLRPHSKVLVASALHGNGLQELRTELRSLYDQYRASNADEPETNLTW